MKKLLGSFCLILLYINSTAQTNTDLRLWYNNPAQSWNEALPVGNGRLAAMLFGNPAKEQLQLNEETIWTGRPYNNVTESQGAVIKELQQLLFEKKYAAAQSLSKEKMKAAQNGMSYQPAGDLLISFPSHEVFNNYYRELDISKASATVRYKHNNITFTRTLIAPLNSNVMVFHCKAGKKKALSFTMQFYSPHSNSIKMATNNMLFLNASPAVMEQLEPAIRYEIIAAPVIKDGSIELSDSSLTVSNATEASIYISIATNFKKYNDVTGDANALAIQYLLEGMKHSFPALQKENTKAYRQYFNRTQLNLGASSAAQKALPTDERLRQFNNAFDPEFINLYFQLGRYLMIAGSQPGGQPTNLQGKWNDKVKPGWDSKYTININTEMNYWPSEPTNLPELGEPLFRMIRDLSETGKEAAAKLYGARGWVTHHNTDLWRMTGPVDGGFYGMWPMGGAWLTRHLWEHYLFTGDTAFLRAYYPVLKNASLFYATAMKREPDHGWLVMMPSMSPENTYMRDSSGGIGLTYGTTMDNQIIFELLSNTINAAAALQADTAFADSLKTIRSQLPPMQIGQYGQLQEWIMDWDKKKDGHRHISHLYGLHPSNQVSPYRTPELFAAANTTLLSRGDISTGWSMGWKVNFWARMKNGDHAYTLIKNQLKYVAPEIQGTSQGGGTYPNLLDAHPPFQIDGNFGCTAGIAEMLLQSQDGSIELLPALPAEWKNGHIKGLRARGGFVIDMQWKNSRLTQLLIHSTLGGNCRIRVDASLIPSGNMIPAKGENSNRFYAINKVPAPLVNAKANVELLPIKPTKEYEMQTAAGKIYRIPIR
ncbi:MAG: glycoside hydrolase family 95 protein [Ferruginibacter sp.]